MVVLAALLPYAPGTACHAGRRRSAADIPDCGFPSNVGERGNRFFFLSEESTSPSSVFIHCLHLLTNRRHFASVFYLQGNICKIKLTFFLDGGGIIKLRDHEPTAPQYVVVITLSERPLL